MINELDFAWEGADQPGPWGHLAVVSFRGHEQISTLYRYELTLLARPPSSELDPRSLIGARGSLRLATHTTPAHRVVHGVIAEAEELGPSGEGTLYRLVLVPPLVRAAHRTGCRIFLDKTTRQILDAVLGDDPSLSRQDGAGTEEDDGDATSFTPARELYTYRLAETARLDSPTVRSYCVQYNESDLAFVSRLLEEEGISYHFENGAGVCLLVLTDNDRGRARLEPWSPLGDNLAGREVHGFKLGARMRARQVALGDYNWKKPALDMLARASGDEGAGHLYEYPGGFNEAPADGAPLATAIRERLGTEADYATGEGKCRLLSAGSIFDLQHAKSRYDGEYLVTRLDVRGHQQGVLKQATLHDEPFSAQFECARRGRLSAAAESHFRPARVTPRPRIHGSQTAFVTDEPTTRGNEIHIGGPAGGQIGCVRVRFHWDREADRHAREPTSCWVRVNQMFAGMGHGGVFHPRVGVEVIVEFEGGDPDRPLITGRVYNGANQPPKVAPTFSTFKTFTSPANGKYNELSFEDSPGAEEVKVHAARDHNKEVGRNRSEQIAADSSSSVGVNRTESTGANRSTSVGAFDSEVVGASQSLGVGLNQSVSVGVNQTLLVGADQSVMVGGNVTESVGGNVGWTVGGLRTTSIGATDATVVGADHSINAGGAQALSSTGVQTLISAASQAMSAPAQAFTAGGLQKLSAAIQLLAAGALNEISAGALQSTGAPVVIVDGEGVLILNGSLMMLNGGTINVSGGTVAVDGGTVSVKGGSVSVDGGGSIDMKAGVIKLN